LYVAGRRVKLFLALPPSAVQLDPPPGSGAFAFRFRAWRNINVKAKRKRNQFSVILIKTVSRYVPTMIAKLSADHHIIPTNQPSKVKSRITFKLALTR
jgi:hypothetical protein